MSFINNPLGSGGTSYQGLGNLTSGIQALQRTEIESKLRSLEQEKANKRADALRNEEFALKMASTDVINDRRVAIAEQAAKDAESFMQANADLVKKAQSEGRGLTLSEKMKIMTDQKKILQNNAQAANFTDALEKAQSIHISTLKTLKDPVSKEQYNKQWADLYQRMKDPVLSKDLSPSDIIAAVEPPDPPVAVVFNETAKELIPFVDKAVKEGANGREIVDEEAFMKSIKTSIDPNGYLFQKGVEENRWKTPEEMYGQLADKVRTSIGIKPTGRRPLQGKEADVIVEIPTYVESVDPKVMSGEGVSIPRSGRAFSVTIGQGEDRTAAKFTPTQYVDGVLQGEFKGVKYVTREGVDAVQAKRDAKGDSRIKLKNERTVGDKRVVDAVYPEVDTWYGSVPYGQVRDEVKDKFPTIDAKYNAEIGAKSAKQTQQRSDITQEQYAKLKKGETYFYQGKEYTKK